jgi:hypothetical protein
VIIRFALECAGCEEPFVVRVGADSTSGTKFYFPCPHCHLPTHAFAQGDGPEDFTVTFAETRQLALDGVPEPARVVTANPFVPAKYDADWNSPQVASSMATLMFLLGSETMTFMGELARGREAAAVQWPMMRRLYEYYLDQNWPLFDRTFARHFAEYGLPEGPTQHERATRAHQPLLAVLGSIVSLTDSGEYLLRRYSNKHTAALRVPAYRDAVGADSAAGEVAALQRLTFDVVDLFVARREMWAMGGIRRMVGEGKLAVLDDLTLPRDEFGETRDLYQQAFEAICKSLRYLVMAQNTVKRGAPGDFGKDHPAEVSPKSRATSLKGFDRLPNAFKLAYVRQVPGWAVLADVLDSRTRNTIGHATARHDLRTGRVVSDKDPVGVPYLRFVSSVHAMFEMLAIQLQVLRFTAVAGSPDFKR